MLDFRDEQLQSFWKRRTTLNQCEWKAFRNLVYAILVAKNRSESKQIHIDDFFTCKAWKPTLNRKNKLDVLMHVGRLQIAFIRYLRDIKKSAAEKRQKVTDNDPELIENLPTEFSMGEPLALPDTTYKVIEASARDFLLGQEPWVGLVLRHHYFGTPPVPLSRFKELIPAYHYRCNAKNFGSLMSGWLGSLRRPFSLEDEEFTQSALEILRQQSLLLVKNELR